MSGISCAHSVGLSHAKDDTIKRIAAACNKNGGSGLISAVNRRQLQRISKILNIGWIPAGASKDVIVIYPRSSSCQNKKHRLGKAIPELSPKLMKSSDSLIV